MADDLDAGREDLIAVGMVEVEVRVDDRRYRLIGDRFDLLEQHPGGRGRHVVVHDDDVAVVDDDRRVADHRQRAGADGVVDALLDLVEPERLAGERRSSRALALGRHGIRGPIDESGSDEHQTSDDDESETTHDDLR